MQNLLHKVPRRKRTCALVSIERFDVVDCREEIRRTVQEAERRRAMELENHAKQEKVTIVCYIMCHFCPWSSLHLIV